MGELPLIAVTIGDPAGIGPEIVARLFAEYEPQGSRAVLVGAPEAYGPWLERAGLDVPIVASEGALESVDWAQHAVVMLDTGVRDEFEVARETPGGGRHAGRAIEMACELARNESVAGIVTAPISKKSLNLADFQYPGHTEMLAHYLISPDCQMMMVFRDLRVVPMTRHIPLRDVASRISESLVLTCLRETHRALVEWFGIEAPRIAVAGLNPHAGEGGVIGTEERDVIAPVLDRVRLVGMDVAGPMPADSMFQSAGRLLDTQETRAENAPPGYDAPDAYVTMYHDQGLVPFKMAARRRGVNVTVGLPVIRTSVDHGSAYDIAGQGIAETASLLEAYELAETLARNRMEI